MILHQVEVEKGRAGFRGCCSSCMWTSLWWNNRAKAVADALDHQVTNLRAA